MIKHCPSFDGYYADDVGNIYSDKTPGSGTRHGNLRPIAKHLKHKFNRFSATLTSQGKSRGVYVAVLVADAFFGPRPRGMCALHGPLGSRVDTLPNIYYGDRARNQRDRVRDGTASRGEANPNAKLTYKQVAEIRAHYRPRDPNYGRKALAKHYNVSDITIGDIIAKRTWGGFVGSTEKRASPDPGG